MHLLVTGGTGFIGSRVVRLLVEGGHRVRCLVRAGRPGSKLEGLAVERHTGDILEAAGLREAVRGCEGVLHLASLSSWSDLRAHADRLDAIIVGGTRNVLDAVKAEAPRARVVFVSSSA